MGMNNMTDGDTANIADLLANIDYVPLGKRFRVEETVSGVTSDSRAIELGWMFIAIPGVAVDGHEFIGQALANGCSVLVVQEGSKDRSEYENLNVCVIEVDDCREVYALIASNCYGNPANDLRLVGITGTNGKTTITYLLEEILIGMGHPVGVIGTVDYRWFGRDCKQYTRPALRTTPDAMELQSLLRSMVDVGVEYVFMEVSSHALVQQRIGLVQFEVAAFTNLSHDHLDYHKKFEDYFAAKSILFSSHLQDAGKAVIMVPGLCDSSQSWPQKMVDHCRKSNVETVVCGDAKNVDIQLISQSYDLEGSSIVIEAHGEQVEFASPLVGRFNVENILTTYAIADALGLDGNEVVPRLAKATGAPGRLQRVSLQRDWNSDNPEVFVDYAHTPDALKKVLETLSEIPHGDLICIFGCGGDRDNSKRSVMGEIGATLSTVSIVTSDNPRSEDPHKIVEQVVKGVIDSGLKIKESDWLLSRTIGEKGCLVIEDRAEAIRLGVSSAKRGDIVLIAGKGHEKYQLTVDGERFFDDCIEAKEAMISWNADRIESSLSKVISGTVKNWWSNKVVTDSRQLKKGDVFIALEGENFDGHEYVTQAAEKDASIVIVSNVEGLPSEDVIPRIVVKDSLIALGELASYHRKLVQDVKKTNIVGITGSCGKTTVKEMVSSIFNAKYPAGKTVPQDRVLKTQGNFNNLIGLPLSLFPLCVKHEVAVLEMGMNRSGEIEALASIAGPNISCITNVHAAHLEELQNIEGVAKAKRELFDNTTVNGTLVINNDDEILRVCASEYIQKKIWYGKKDSQADLDVTASEVHLSDNGCVSFLLEIKDFSGIVQLLVAGEHNVSNALAASAIAYSAGIPGETIIKGLETFKPVDKRMEIVKVSAGLSVINDCYNANPASMSAAIKTLSSMNVGGKIAVLGDMLELGSSSDSAHKAIGEFVATLKIDYLALFGKASQYTKQGALAGGMTPQSVKHFENKDELLVWLSQLIELDDMKKDAWLLLKGSRGMKMETILEKLKEK